MRRNEKRITDMDVIESVLDICTIGHLGTIDSDGRAMVKPVNYVYHDKAVYFHTAPTGEKIADIRRDSRVCFEAALPIAFIKAGSVPCNASFLYRSVIIKGRARLVEIEKEKTNALKLLLKKFQPDSDFDLFPDENLRKTAVIRIDIENMSGKEDLGEGRVRELALQALKNPQKLPVVIDPAR